MLQLNSIVFPKPSPSYTDKDPLIRKINSIPSIHKVQTNIQLGTQSHKIPCLFLEHEEETNIHLIFFHGNAEDLGYAKSFLFEVQYTLRVNIIAMEYPSYGIYTDKAEPSQEQIEEDSISVYQYLLKDLKVPESNIIVFGRSMGGGPACYLASIFQPRCLILMSAFSSLRNVATKHAFFLGYLIKDRFPNSERAKTITCPSFLIHGKSDNLIPYQQSEQIYQNLKSTNKESFFPELMTHNEFEMDEDLLTPIQNFLFKIQQNIDGLTQKKTGNPYTNYQNLSKEQQKI